MKKALFTLACALVCTSVFSQNLVMSLEQKAGYIFVGDSIDVHLNLYPEDSSLSFSPWRYYCEKHGQPFYTFTKTFTDEGEVILTPIIIDLFGKTLTSNKLTLEIKNPKLKGDFIDIEAPDTIQSHKQVQVTLVCLHHDISDIEMAPNESIYIKSESSSSQLQGINGETFQVYKKTFNLVFLKKGEYKFNSDSFSNAHPLFDVANKTILVE